MDGSGSDERPLESWKEIARYLNRDARTVMRWEKGEGLPVHRHRHLARSSVYAFPRELDAWRVNRQAELLQEPPPRRRMSPVVAVAAAALVSIVNAGDRYGPGLDARQAGPEDTALDWPADALSAGDASMSPDGRYVSYIDRATRELHVRDLQDARTWGLTRLREAGGFVGESAISTDSRFIAFTSADAGGARPGLRVLPLDASPSVPPRVLADGAWIVPHRWSADRRFILVTIERDAAARHFDIALVSAADGRVEILTTIDFPGPGEHVVLSPDGRFVAYDMKAEANRWQRDVYIAPVAGGPAVAVLTGPVSDSVVGWSADGNRLVIRSDRSGSEGVGLWAVPMGSQGSPAGEPVLLQPDFPGDALTLTAGGTLFYERTRRTSELLVTRIDPEVGSRLSAPEQAAHDRHAFSRRPRWSADGRQLLYETRRPTGPVLSIRTMATGMVREVPLNLSYVWTFDWSPDTTTLVCRALDLQGRTGLFLVDTRTGDVRPFALWVENVVRYFAPQFTEDGRAVTYIRGDLRGDARRAAYVARDIETGVERVIRDRPGVGSALRRSPNGQILLAYRASAESSILAILDTRTNETRDIFRVDRPSAFSAEDGVQWTADGRALLVNLRGTTENERTIWWVPLDGMPRQVDIGVSTLADGAIAVHPDGRQIAFVAGDPVPSRTAVLDSEFRRLDHLLPADR